MVRVLLRGLVASPLAGAVSGLAVAVPIIVLGLLSEPTSDVTANVGAAVFYLAYGGLAGGACGLVVGVPTTVVLVLLSPTLRQPHLAAVASSLVAAAVAGVLGAVATQNSGFAWGAALACALVGGLVGRFVVLGRQR